jgi:catechol 2,3-dioxygenase-like lactoylglutathione lyase family enzyme
MTIKLIAICVMTAQPSCDRTPPRKSPQSHNQSRSTNMELGAFSVSLAVKDIAKSREFYEKLGFNVLMGEQEQNWLILQNGHTTIGLFQGMFDKNCLTFNPGWANDMNHPDQFTDVRDIEKQLKEAGIKLETETDKSTPTGPASLTLFDPDGNPILLDQHR